MIESTAPPIDDRPPAARLLAELAAALGAMRRARGLRQADVAERMGTTQSCVSDFERAKTNPELAFVARYAAAVGAELRIAVEPLADERRTTNDECVAVRHSSFVVRRAAGGAEACQL